MYCLSILFVDILFVDTLFVDTLLVDICLLILLVDILFVDTLFVAFWNGTDYAQRIVWIDPNNLTVNEEGRYIPQPFITGLIRPVDVTVAPDGSLVVADFIYGHIWQVSYGEDGTQTSALPPVIQTVASDTEATEEALPPIIATVVSNEANNQQVAPSTPTADAGGLVFATATPSD